MATNSEVPWRSQSADERRRERRQRLFEAALGLVDAEGLSAVTVRGVCTRAKLTSRYFYESFASSRELLSALYDELAEQAMSNALTVLALDSPAADIARIQQSLSAGTDRLDDSAPSIRFLLSHATADPVLNARRRRFVALVSGRMAEASARSHKLPHAPLGSWPGQDSRSEA